MSWNQWSVSLTYCINFTLKIQHENSNIAQILEVIQHSIQVCILFPISIYM